MAKIRDTGVKDRYTGGNEKELITDDGKKYIIRGTATKSPYTGKHDMEIVEGFNVDTSGLGFLESLALAIVTLVVGGGAIIGMGALCLFISSLLS